MVTGNQFTVRGTLPYYFEMIELIVSRVNGANKLDVWLMSDAAGQPGAIIEAFQFSGAIGQFGQNNPLSVGSSGLNPVLNPIIDYWITAFVPQVTGQPGTFLHRP